MRILYRIAPQRVPKDEFTKAMENDRVVHAMLSLGVDIKDAALFFNTLAKMNDTHEVSVDDIVHSYASISFYQCIDVHVT